MDQGLRMINIVSSLQGNENQEMKVCLRLPHDVHWPGKICQLLIKTCQKTPSLQNPRLTEEDKCPPQATCHMISMQTPHTTQHGERRVQIRETVDCNLGHLCEIRVGLIISPGHRRSWIEI